MLQLNFAEKQVKFNTENFLICQFSRELWAKVHMEVYDVSYGVVYRNNVSTYIL